METFFVTIWRIHQGYSAFVAFLTVQHETPASCNFVALSTRTTPDFLWSCPVKLLSSGNPLFLFAGRSRFSIYEAGHCFRFLLLFSSFFFSFIYLFFFFSICFHFRAADSSSKSRRRDSRHSCSCVLFLIFICLFIRRLLSFKVVFLFFQRSKIAPSSTNCRITGLLEPNTWKILSSDRHWRNKHDWFS